MNSPRITQKQGVGWMDDRRPQFTQGNILLMSNKLNKLMISVCCVCNKVKDDGQRSEWPTGDAVESWMTLRSFIQLHGLGRDDYKLLDTYCAQCLEQLHRIGRGLQKQ